MNFRLMLQPTMAIILAVRAGLRDGRQGRPPFLWSAITDPDHRRQIIREGWRDIGRVFFLAAALDAIYQLIVNRGVYLGEMLITSFVLAIVPYVLVRGPVTRIARRLAHGQGETSRRKRAA